MTYRVRSIPSDLTGDDLAVWLYQELSRLADTVETLDYITERHAEPNKPFAGQVAFADGTDWNPGSGAGLYQYRSSTWNLLG